MRKRHSRAGHGLFTLVMVLAILAILIGLLLPALQKVQGKRTSNRGKIEQFRKKSG